MNTDRESRPQWRGVPATPSVTTHVVAAGESVWSIATAHGLRPADVLAWNGLDWSSVRSRMTLTASGLMIQTVSWFLYGTGMVASISTRLA